METPLTRSIACLAATRNEAALDALIAALDNAPDTIRFQALNTLLGRKSPRANREIIRRWPEYPPEWHHRLGESATRLATQLEAALLGTDAHLAQAACRAAVGLRDYDLIAPLVTALESRKSAGNIAAETLLALTDCLYEELHGPRDYSRRRDPKLVRRFVLAALESSVGRFSEHGCLEPLEAFLALTGRENATLRSVLHAPRGELHQAFLTLLTRSQRAGVIRLLLSFLDDANSPRIVLKIIANRSDDTLLNALLEKMQHESPPAFQANLARLDSLAWVSPAELPRRWKTLTDATQQAAARLIMHSGMKTADKKAAIVSLLNQGQPGARCVATASLAEFTGADVNQLVLSLINDADPQVQACALVQLRQRNLPGSIATLIKRLESPSTVVSNAARSCLQEFTFPRFLAAFEEMTPAVRRSTGALVKKVDSQAVPLLIGELHSSTRSCRLRALEIAPLLGTDKRLQAAVIVCLNDPDHQVRAEAARKLAKYPGEVTIASLRKVLTDSSVTVQDAAEQSLQQLNGTQHRDEKSTVQWADLLEAGLRAQK